MKLLAPYIGSLDEADARLLDLAAFLGIAWEGIPLPDSTGFCLGPLEKAASFGSSCLAVNPRVIARWMGRKQVPKEFASFVVSRFSYLLVHATRPKPFDVALVSALSGGLIHSVEECGGHPSSYGVSLAARDICGEFAGISFERTNMGCDRVFSLEAEPSPARDPILLGGRPLVARLKRQAAEILFLGGQDIAELRSEVDDRRLSDYFSSFVVPAMCLRYIFGENCWRPRKHYASVIVDDPLLRPEYGFLKFAALLDLMKERSFHTAVAFIPHNCRRSSATVARLLREHPSRFSLCFHGNDHTGGEFASTNTALLNTMLGIAERRMSVHSRLTGLECDRVMVFPQGKFSAAAMAVLKARHFDAVVNTVAHPVELPGSLTLGELAEPAILRYDGLPLFLRAGSVRMRSFEIAFQLFFGRPVFIVEHHDGFQHPDELLAAVSRINAAAPDVHWVSPGTAASEALLWRHFSDGAYSARAYSQTVRVSNESYSVLRLRIEWPNGEAENPPEIAPNAASCEASGRSASATALTLDLPPGASTTLSIFARNGYGRLKSLGARRIVWAVVRRRLSEFRDNHLSRRPLLLAAARTLQKRYLP